MSSVLASVSQLKPEIRLAQAVSQFEADLSSEQKTTFRTCRIQTRDSPPDLQDVMRLTAEIDRQACGKAGGRHCFGPRLTNFLQAVQQFAALGDIVVGGSQNMIACGVWSVVRLSLLSIVNFSSYLEKLSTLLMTIGRSAPRYQKMALLYPHSKNLQSYLSEYFIAVVNLCHQLLKFTQKSILGQVLSAQTDFHMNAHQAELDLWANSIKEEANLLLSKKVDEESQENSRFRALSKDFSRLVLHQQKMKTNLRVLDLCSVYDYEMTWKQTRKIGYTALLNQNTKYQKWKCRANSSTLFYTGKLGSGKSVLLANIVDDMSLYVDTQDLIVSYFFCRHDITESLKARTIFGSLARQLLRSIQDLTVVEGLVDKCHSPLGLDEIFALLERAIPVDFRAYFILDGLDDCDNDERKLLCHQLQKLQSRVTLALCVSIRLEPENVLNLTSEQYTVATVTSIPGENPDIERFISEELESCIESKELVIGHPALVLEIQDALMEGSQGMFLWVALQIKALCGMKTDDSIRQALADLPKDLSETFSRILQRSETSGKPYQRPILELVTVAHRLLTVAELREALSVIPGNITWNPARLLNDVYSTLNCCGSLLVVDEEELTVRFVHHSVKQFLSTEFKDPGGTAFTVDANRRMANIIVTYLNYGIFGTQISTLAIPQFNAHSAPAKIIRSATNSASSVQNLALKLLKSRKRPDYDMGKVLAETSKLFSPGAENEYHFLYYAKPYWLQHILFVSAEEPALHSSVLRLFKGEMAKFSMTDEDLTKLVISAAEMGYVALFKLLRDSGKFDINSNDNSLRRPLVRAVKGGHKELVQWLLDSNAADPNLSDGSGQTPLILAAKKGDTAIVKLLLNSNKIEPNLGDRNKYTALTWAVYYGHKNLVKLLLESSKVDPNITNIEGEPPLTLAAKYKYEDIFSLLLDSGKLDISLKDSLPWAAVNGYTSVVELLLHSSTFNVNPLDEEFKTALSLAAENGHSAIVKLLLDSGKVDVNFMNSYSETPMCLAARKGHEVVVKLLLGSSGIDVDSKDILGESPLSYAAHLGHGAIVKLLLDSGKVDVNSKNDYLQTPMCFAAMKGHEVVVKLLLDSSGIDVNSKDAFGQSPLSYAADHGYSAIVKLLLDSGKVNVNSMNSHLQTPMCLAAMNGHKVVVKLLLDSSGIDVDSKDAFGQSPLSYAAENGHRAIVKLLKSYKGQMK